MLRAIAGVTVLGAVAAVGAAAVAGPARDARVAKESLTPKERKALRVVSVDAVGSEPVGLIVTVTFAGNLEQALGRGHLKSGLVALVLRPSDPSLAPAYLATTGPGAIGTTLRKTRSTDAGVVRNGRRLTFFVNGPGAGSVGTIALKVFAAFPAVAARRATQDEQPTWWEAVEQEIARSEDDIPAPSAATSCSSLQRMQARVDSILKTVRDRETRLKELKRGFQDAVRDLEADLSTANWVHAEATIGAVVSSFAAPLTFFTSGPAAGVASLSLHAYQLGVIKTARDKKEVLRAAIRSLKLDVKLADALMDVNAKLIPKVSRAKGAIEAYISIACNVTISEDDTWTHNPPLGKSNVCVNVRTSPAQAKFEVQLTGPGGFNKLSGVKPLVNGAGQFIGTIKVAGEFTKTIEVFDAEGNSTATVTHSFTVADPPQDGPKTDPPCPKPTE